MADAARPGGHEETPVNPYNLLEAVNRASAATRTGWLVSLLILAFAALPLAGITHRDLLLETPVTLPLVNLAVPLLAFAGKVHAFDAAIRTLETTDRRTHPLRLEIHPYFLTEAIAGPRSGWPVRAALRLAGGLGVVLLPACVLLAVQAAFLPFHSAPLTQWHRALVLADLALVIAFAVFLAAPGHGWGRALGRMIAVKPFASFLGLLVVSAMAATSLGLATVPGEMLDAVLHANVSGRSGVRVAALEPVERLLPRYLRPGRAILGAGEANAGALDLSRRDLAGANLEETRLAGIDLTGANLQGARLAGADLGGARLAGANLEYANLDRAWLAGADLTAARLVAATLKGAVLDGAVLAGVHGEGSALTQAALSGADLSGAVMMGADLTGTVLAGANLAGARLDAAQLKDADLEAATLSGASLFASDLTGARIGAADLRRARVWHTGPPQSDGGGLADLGDIELRAPDEKAVADLRQAIAAVGLPEGVAVLNDALRGVLDAGERAKWQGGAGHGGWQSLASSGAQSFGGYRSRLGEALVRLACKPRVSTPGITIGVVRRSASRDFRGDAAEVADRLKADDCAAARNLPAHLLQDLAAAAERSRAETGRAEAGRPEPVRSEPVRGEAARGEAQRGDTPARKPGDGDGEAAGARQ
jgi:uncharacterized protein YjbI with pentapeptide repeats